MNRLLFAFLVISMCVGCTTQQTIGKIKNHADNIEVKIDYVNQQVKWISSPDFEGSAELPKISSCEKTRYFVFTSLLGHGLTEVSDDYESVSLKPKESKIADYASELQECDLAFVETRTCESPCYLTEPVAIETLNKEGKSEFVFSPEKREEIPKRKWPVLGFTAILDIPLALVSIPWLLWHTATH